jgi:riboflavin synthase
MFTGIIQEIGSISSRRTNGKNVDFVISGRRLVHKLAIGDSVSISGACLTVTSIDKTREEFAVSAVDETLKKSKLDGLRHGSRVNLELALKMSDRLGGHLVQGHVDAVGQCESIKKVEGSWIFDFSAPKENSHLIIEKGSIAIDGVSLTAIKVRDSRFSVSIIPHTHEKTTLGSLREGDMVNLEFDLIGKYVHSILHVNDKDKLSFEKLAKYGF